MNLLMVFIGGGLGSLCRYGIAHWMHLSEWTSPVGTFLANMAACFILGLLLAFHFKGEMTDQLRLLLITGFCGGFSTFSTFSYENYDLLQSGEYGSAFLNIGFSLILGLVFVFLGLKTLS